MWIRSQRKKLFITMPLSLAVLVLVAAPTSRLRASGSNIPLFLPAVTYNSGGQGAMSAAVADVNGDGKPDLVVLNACSSSVGCSNSEPVGVLLGNGDGTFQPAMTYGSGGASFGLGSVVIADVNGDGKPDLVVTNACGADSNCTNGSVGVLLGNGNGTFQPAVTYNSGGYFDISVAVADVNEDGKPDLLVLNDCAGNICAGDGLLGVLLGNGDGSFQQAVTYSSGGKFARWVAVADVNGDGKPDVLTANDCNRNCTSGLVGVLLGNGDGTFQAAAAYDSNGSQRKSVAVADVNDDGKPDLLVANYCAVGSTCSGGGPGAVDVLLGNGDGTFRPAATYSSGADDANSVAVADVNGDGKPDLLVINQCADLINCRSGTISVLLGNGDGTFQPAVTYDSGGYIAQSVAVADVNGDGKPDLLVANFSIDFFNLGTGAVGVLLNNTPFDTTPPSITLSATPKLLWPANGRMVPVTVMGTITDTGSGVNTKTAAYVVKDEYGEVQPRGTIALGPIGSYSFTILLQASRLGTDLDGRRYTITVQASDNAANIGSKTTVVTVPHDRGH
jgi:hypothetical protein